ncbi:ATP-binding cassette domain-containing protein, partial [Leclercia adecarboxylata]|nr:ATP-binding cassette domain-containing protein [Leclercia adecarboxylata]
MFRDGHYIGLQRSDSMNSDSLISMMVGRELSQLFPVRETPIGNLLLSVRNLNLDGVFKDVSFDLHAGEILGIAGLMGSGRTNVAETIFGITLSSSGQISLD